VEVKNKGDKRGVQNDEERGREGGGGEGGREGGVGYRSFRLISATDFSGLSVLMLCCSARVREEWEGGMGERGGGGDIGEGKKGVGSQRG
jgi:hypothetical protein